MLKQNIMTQRTTSDDIEFHLCLLSTLGHLIFLSTETPLEKTNVLFASSYRLETVSQLKMGAVRVTTSPLSFRTLMLYRPMEALCMLPKSLFVPALLCLEVLVSLVFSVLSDC